MPVYAYTCTSCDHQFEQRQSFSDPALQICPECEGALRKVFNSVGIVFKGSGFYRNDSRDSTRNGAAGPGRGERKRDGSSTDGGSSDSSSLDTSAKTPGKNGAGSDSSGAGTVGGGNKDSGRNGAATGGPAGSRDSSSRTAAAASR